VGAPDPAGNAADAELDEDPWSEDSDSGEPELVRRTGPIRSRAGLVYLALVVVPAGIAVVILLARAQRTPTAPPGSGPANTLPGLLLAIAVVIAGCAAMGALFRRLGQPAVIGEIATGILLGPSVLGAVWPGGMSTLFSSAILPQLNAFAQLGVILFVFLAGVEFSGKLLVGRGDIALVVSHVSIAVPFLFGVLLSIVAFTRFAPDRVGFLPFALFFGVSMSITALPVMVRILQHLGLQRSDVGVVALTCAVIGDVTAWILLALVLALTRRSSTSGVLVTVGLTALFAVLVLGVIRPAIGSATPRLEKSSIRYELILSGVVVLVLLAAGSTEKIGMHAIVGAFILGIACPGDSALFRRVRRTLSIPTLVLLLPLFFAYSGLRTDIGLLGFDLGSWAWMLAILAVATAGKLGGAAVAARAVGVPWRPSLQLGVLMNCRGLTELVVLNVGLDIGVISRELFTMMVLMALVSTVLTTPLLRLLRPGLAPARWMDGAGRERRRSLVNPG
jgi:Kef-type K+ transport system membrane component KefB